MAIEDQHPQYGALQEFVDKLYATEEFHSRLDILMEAESFGLCSELMEIVSLLPPARYSRDKLCSQLNSSLSSHGWGYVFGAVH